MRSWFHEKSGGELVLRQGGEVKNKWREKVGGKTLEKGGGILT